MARKSILKKSVDNVVTTVDTTVDTTVVTKQDKVTEVKSVVKGKQTRKKAVTKSDPTESVMTTSPISLRLNNYDKEIIEAAAEMMDLTKQAYIRHAIREYANLHLRIN